MIKVLTIVGLCVVTSACHSFRPIIGLTMLSDPAAPVGVDTEVVLSATKIPDCSYTELAIITAIEGELFYGNDDTLEAMRVRAREIGANAVIGIEYVANGGKRGYYRGTAVRFADPACHLDSPRLK